MKGPQIIWLPEGNTLFLQNSHKLLCFEDLQEGNDMGDFDVRDQGQMLLE